MKRPLIALAAALAIGTNAQAQTQPKGVATSLVVNPHGIGHMLVVPYFNTQSGNSTLLNVFNAGSTSKAVKIRFRDAGNGDELFSFQVFLWRRDAWTVNISTGAGGVPVLTTNDGSCTLPAVITGQSFSTARLNPALAAEARANQAREGYIEIIAMGDVAEGTALETAIRTAQQGGAPCTPTVLGALARFDGQLAPPTTGLTANWILINVPQTTTWAGEAVAFEARLNGAAATGNNTFFPQTAAPLTGADVAGYSADPLYNFSAGGPIVAPTSANLPDLSTPYTATVASPQQQAAALSSAIAAQETLVEYLTAQTIQASTDWVLSMPTRRYHAAVDYRTPILVTNRSTFSNAEAVHFAGLGQMLSTLNGLGQSCYSVLTTGLLEASDREGNSTLTGILNPFGNFVSFCGVVSVLSANDGMAGSSRTTKASATRSLLAQPAAGTDGSATFRWPEGTIGLPVLVRQFSRAVNPAVMPGVSGTFGAVWIGRTTKPGELP